MSDGLPPMVYRVQPHVYSPDAMAMGDCKICGHVADDPLHISFDAAEMIRRAEVRFDERFINEARRAGRTWQTILVGMANEEIAGLDVALEIELERRGMLDRAPHVLRGVPT